MSFITVSDLHIWGPEDPLYRSLISLIRLRASRGDTLVLAGDLFDLFIGNKAIFTRKYSEFLEELRAAGERGASIHYIEGNHDFLIHKAFAGIPGLTVHSHEVSLELAGKRFFVAHGDTVDRNDYGYRLLRGLFRSPLMKAFVTVAPGRVIERIGETSSRGSRGRKPLLPADLPREGMENLRKLYRSYAAERLAQGYDYVVLGHCHDLDEMSFTIDGRLGQYVNVGFPRVHGSFVSWSPGDTKMGREALPPSPTGSASH